VIRRYDISVANRQNGRAPEVKTIDIEDVRIISVQVDTWYPSCLALDEGNFEEDDGLK
jgi:hypothetical protein